MATLSEISARLEQGYFLKEDMDTLGLSGYVSVAQMRAEVATLLANEEKQAEFEARQKQIIEDTKKAFELALKNDPHVQQTPEVLEPQDQKAN